ncbi:hypothetical protein H8356DRAFT_1351108 [Neocallimastix lanati (nom. inval.)]|nr:hypothetical protein H8356DRAFT_1351108 [Neocallimastix sp. JGI-2020a]
MTFDNAQKVATAVTATEMASSSKRKRVSKGKDSATASKKRKGSNSDGFHTRGIITKSDVALMIENKQKNIEFIVSKEKNHNGDIALDHIHSYLNYVDGPINSRNLRYFDLTNLSLVTILISGI